MATEQGVLEALWGELRLAVEARLGTEIKPFVVALRRRRTAEFLALAEATLAQPPVRLEPALRDLAKSICGLAGPEAAASTEALRAQLFDELVRLGEARWANCRLLWDQPYPDRIWLHRNGRWLFYRWREGRFLGVTLEAALDSVSQGRASRHDLLLDLAVGGILFPNPKLPKA